MFWDEVAGVAPAPVEAAKAFDAQAFGERLKKARLAAGVRQVPAAEALGVSQATYSRMEAGRIEAAKVTSTLLERASATFGRSMVWLLEGSPVRDRVRLAARRTDEADVRECASRVLDLLERDAELDSAAEFADLDGGPTADRGVLWSELRTPQTHPSRRQGAERAQQLRALLDIGDGPIDDLTDLLEQRLGIDVAAVALDGGLSGVVAFDDERLVALVAVNAAKPRVHQRFTFAHEVGHLLFGDGHAYGEEQSARRSPAEKRADKFAQHFLIPEAGIRNWLHHRGYPDHTPVSFDDACRLADAYGVSPQTAWIALADLGIAPDRQAPTAAGAAVVANSLARFRAEEESSHVERVPARIETRVLAAFRHGLLTPAAAAEVLGQDPALLADAASVIDRPTHRSASGQLATR